MRHFHDIQQSPYSPRQLFDLVLDIERYPEFLPWCRAARITERGEGRMMAELVISFKHITENYASEITYQRPEDGGQGRIDVTLVRGPFSHLQNHWNFSPLPAGGSEIALDLSFQFRSSLLDAIIGLLFGKASAKMVGAFRERADRLYGQGCFVLLP